MADEKIHETGVVEINLTPRALTVAQAYELWVKKNKNKNK